MSLKSSGLAMKPFHSTMTPSERLMEIRAADKAGQPVEVLPFLEHDPTGTGETGIGSLSQWWPQEFTVDGVVFKTAAHWMMAERARLVGDECHPATALSTSDPREAHFAVRRVRNINEERWAAARYDIVVAGNLAKFDQNEHLKEVLLGTGDKVLAQACSCGETWSTGIPLSNPDVLRPSVWPGLNLLGFALMEVRDHLRQLTSCRSGLA